MIYFEAEKEENNMFNYNIYDIIADLNSDRKKKVIFDSDTFNDVDDQFAIAYAMLSPEKVDLLGLTAAPFTRKEGIGYGMELSYKEIQNICGLCNVSDVPILKGAEDFMSNVNGAVNSSAAEFIIEEALKSKERIYVIGTGPATNIGSALAICPEIKDKIVVVWLGINGGVVPNPRECNLKQDKLAAKTIFDSEAPVVLIRVNGVSSVMDMSIPEFDAYLKGRNKLCDYLHRITTNAIGKELCQRRVLWDVAAASTVVLPDPMLYTVVPSPIITEDGYAINDPTRHPIISGNDLHRQMIFSDMLQKFWNIKD